MDNFSANSLRLNSASANLISILLPYHRISMAHITVLGRTVLHTGASHSQATLLQLGLLVQLISQEDILLPSAPCLQSKPQPQASGLVILATGRPIVTHHSLNLLYVCVMSLSPSSTPLISVRGFYPSSILADSLAEAQHDAIEVKVCSRSVIGCDLNHILRVCGHIKGRSGHSTVSDIGIGLGCCGQGRCNWH